MKKEAPVTCFYSAGKAFSQAFKERAAGRQAEHGSCVAFVEPWGQTDLLVVTGRMSRAIVYRPERGAEWCAVYEGALPAEAIAAGLNAGDVRPLSPEDAPADALARRPLLGARETLPLTAAALQALVDGSVVGTDPFRRTQTGELADAILVAASEGATGRRLEAARRLLADVQGRSYPLENLFKNIVAHLEQGVAGCGVEIEHRHVVLVWLREIGCPLELAVRVLWGPVEWVAMFQRTKRGQEG